MNKSIFSRILMVVLCVAMLLATAIPAMAATYVEITGGTVNVRSGPGLNYEDLYTLKKNHWAEYTGSSSTDSRGVVWYEIYYPYGTGWVSSKNCRLVSDGNAPASGSGNYVKATARVNVRNSPNQNSSDIGTLLKGDTARYLGETSVDIRGITWYKVNHNGNVGWVSSRYSTLTNYASSSSSSSSSSGSYGTVKGVSGDSNIRTEPNLGGKSINVMYKGETASYLGNSSVDNRGVTWYQVRFEGETGWVSSRYTQLY